MISLLLVSNGIGEDSIGAAIIRQLPPAYAPEAYATLGPGLAYSGLCPLVGPRAELPSQGSRVGRGTLARDVAAGGLATIPPGLRFLHAARRTYDRVLVVGDFVGVLGCRLAGISDIVWLDVYRSGFGRLYSPPERWILKRTAQTVFCRSPDLAASLVAAGIDARFAGNVMMDTIARAGYDVMSRRTHPLAVTLLPGSRDATAANFALQVAALRLLPQALQPDVFLALADGIDAGALAAGVGATPEPERGRMRLGDLTIHVARGALGDLVEASDLVLSQAGTASIQALGLGRPVLQMSRPQDRRKRLAEESRLFGQARIVVPAEAGALAAAMAALLADPIERARLGAVARARIGPPGAIKAIVASLA